MKNLNSFNYVRKGLEYEEKRQEEELLNGGEIGQETRRFDESTGKTILMRVKKVLMITVTSQNQTLYLYTLMKNGKNVFVKQSQNYRMNVKLNM